MTTPLVVAALAAALGWAVAVVCWLAALAAQSEVTRQRRARDVADYACHKAEQRLADLQRERDVLLMRLARTRGEAEAVLEAAAGVALLGQLDALRAPSESA